MYALSIDIMLKPTKNETEEISALDTLQIRWRITKALISLRGYAGWSATLLFASNKIRGFHVEANMMLKPRLLSACVWLTDH